jgi:hypothetical protein
LTFYVHDIFHFPGKPNQKKLFFLKIGNFNYLMRCLSDKTLKKSFYMVKLNKLQDKLKKSSRQVSCFSKRNSFFSLVWLVLSPFIRLGYDDELVIHQSFSKVLNDNRYTEIFTAFNVWDKVRLFMTTLLDLLDLYFFLLFNQKSSDNHEKT